VPGHQTHPVSDPRGHSFGQLPTQVAAPEPALWSQCQPYLRGIDLFNHGYYWEAHEEWESLWHACGRQGATADFIKGLIQLAVAGVKIRQGLPESAQIHAKRAFELFKGVAENTSPSHSAYMGLDLAELIELASDVAAKAKNCLAHPDLPVEIVIPHVLLPK
jgi:predicted metal-dependent hydrolase